MSRFRQSLFKTADLRPISSQSSRNSLKLNEMTFSFARTQIPELEADSKWLEDFDFHGGGRARHYDPETGRWIPIKVIYEKKCLEKQLRRPSSIASRSSASLYIQELNASLNYAFSMFLFFVLVFGIRNIFFNFTVCLLGGLAYGFTVVPLSSFLSKRLKRISK